MQTLLQPYIIDIVNALFGLVAAVIIAVIIGLRKKVEKMIADHTTASQRTILHVMAKEAFSYAQTVFNNKGGQDKLKEALTYVDNRLEQYGVKFTEEEIRAAIEKAYLEHNKSETPAVSTIPTEIK